MSQPENELRAAAQAVIEWENEYRTLNNLGKYPPQVFIWLATALASRAPATSEYERGATWMLDSVRSSLQDWPNGPCDIEVGKLVTELIERGRRDGLEQADRRFAKLGDELNQCLQIIITNAGNIKERSLVGFQIDRAAIAIEDAVQRAAKAIRALAATSGTPAEHVPARAPHNKFASLWCDACPRPTSGTPAPPRKVSCPLFYQPVGGLPGEPPEKCERVKGHLGRCDQMESCSICGRPGVNEFDAHAPCGLREVEAAAPTTTNVREAFEKWYAAYKDITLYIDGMQDAFEAGYNARSNERDAQAAPGPKCSHGVLMREFCQGCEDAP